jgi:hypothetical protein
LDSVWSAGFCAANAVKVISATSAREIHRPDGSSNTASGYSIGIHAWSSICAIAAVERRVGPHQRPAARQQPSDLRGGVGDQPRRAAW